MFTESWKPLGLTPKMIMVVEKDSREDNSFAGTLTLWGWWLSQVCRCSHSTENTYQVT